tara:strand:- start:341 stop:1273 length:933 start_codon:yes stop_codon:yes gene_type:complete
MKFNLKYTFILVLTLQLIFFTNLKAQTNKILFKVNNEIITTLDILEETKVLKIINKELSNFENEKVYEIAKNSLIRQKIKKIELSKKLKNLDIDNEILDNLFLDYFRQSNIKNLKDLENILLKQNIDVNQVKEKIKIIILWNEYIFAKYSKKIKIDTEDIQRELENKKIQNELKLSELLFNVGENENLNDKMNIIIKTINDKGFSQAALLYSVSSSGESGGEIGWIKSASLNKKIREKVENLAIGEITKPIVVPGGFLMLKIEDKRESEIKLNLEKEIKLISQRKTREQLNQLSNIYFNKIKKDVIVNEL